MLALRFFVLHLHGCLVGNHVRIISVSHIERSSNKAQASCDMQPSFIILERRMTDKKK